MNKGRSREKRLTIRGQVYHVIEWGKKGYPLLFLHGFMGSALDFESVASRFASSRYVLAIDFLGHAKSSSPQDPKRYRIEHIVQDIAAILSDYGIYRTDVVGYSMGGRVALAFATKWATKVRALVLESASPGLATQSLRITRREADEKLAQRMWAYGLPFFVEEWEKLLLFESQTHLSGDIAERQRRVRLSHTITGLTGSLCGLGTGVQPSYWSMLAQVHPSVLLITGQLDAKFTAIAHEMLPLFKYATWKSIEGVGHNTHLENPNAFFHHVNYFLAQVANAKHK